MTLQPPYISIIVPALNEQNFIEESLESVARINYPIERLEVIVVDNGSTDNTVVLAKKFTPQVYNLTHKKVGAVRNYGASIAKGSYFLFLDADCLVPENWINDTLGYMQDNNCSVVGGYPKIRPFSTWVEQFWILKTHFLDGPSHSLVGASIFIKKDTFNAIGGFNEDINAGEDSELARRLNDQRYTVHLTDRASVIHLGYPRSLKAFTKRQYWQASSYLDSKKPGLDPLFLLTLVFLLALITLPLLVVLQSYIALLPLSLLAGIPLILSCKRIIRDYYRSFNPLNYLKIYTLDFFYLLGRSVGLARNIATKLKLLDNGKTYY